MHPSILIWISAVFFSFFPIIITLVSFSDGETLPASFYGSAYRDLLFASIVIGGMAMAESLFLLLKIDRKNDTTIANYALALLMILLFTVLLASMRYGVISQRNLEDLSRTTTYAWVMTSSFCISSVLCSLILKICEVYCDRIKNIREPLDG
jgi:hypothetical protein